MSQTTDAVIAELMDRRLLNDVDDGLHQEIAEAVIKAAQPAVDEDGPLSTRDLAMIDQAWENHKAALPVATVINDNQPGRTAIIEITIDPPTLPVGTKLYAGPKMVELAAETSPGDGTDKLRERLAAIKYRPEVFGVDDLRPVEITSAERDAILAAIDRLDVKAEAKSQEPVAVAWRRRRKGIVGNGGWIMCPEYPGRDREFDLEHLYTHPTTKPEAPAVSVEQLARTIATARGVNPDCLHQNYGDEPVDHEDARGRTFHYGWRNQMHIAMPVAALIAGGR